MSSASWYPSKIFIVLIALLVTLPIQSLTPKQAAAAVGDGATSNIDLFDVVTVDGEVDRITFSIANPNGETWSLEGASPHGLSVTQAGNAVTISSVSITSAATANPVLIRVNLDQADADLVVDTNGVTTNAVELVYTQQTGNQTCTICIRDAIDEEMNTIATGDAGGAVNTEADNMAPVVVSVSPVENVTTVTQTAPVVVTFSEAMNTTFAEETEFTVSQDAGAWTSAFTVSNTVATLTHSAPFVRGTNITVSLVSAQIDAAAGDVTQLVTTGPQDGVWDFTISTAGGSQGSTSNLNTISSPGVTLQTPADNAVLAPGPNTVSYYAHGLGVSTMRLSYLTATGETVEIADDLSNTSTTSIWNVPTGLGTATLTLEGLSSTGAVLVTDTVQVTTSSSAANTSIGEQTPTETDATDTTDDSATYELDNSGRKVALSSGVSGRSPVDGSMEEISAVKNGWVIRSPSYDTVYHIEDGARRPFWDATTFFTWHSSWSEVVWVTDATLATLQLSTPMLPKAGTVLVKIQDNPNVYMLEESAGQTTIRLIPTEAIAISAFGQNWAQYVIDLPATIFHRFAQGEPLASGESVSSSAMKMRTSLR